MKISEFKISNTEQVKDLLVELQKYVISIDKYHLNTLSQEYRDLYFDRTYQQCYDNDGKIFVAIEKGKIIGIVCGYVEQYDALDRCEYTCPKKGIISELIVSSESRNIGLGNTLIARMENYFKSIQCEYCQIDVFAYNKNAINFYQKHDYEDRMVTMFKKL